MVALSKDKSLSRVRKSLSPNPIYGKLPKAGSFPQLG